MTKKAAKRIKRTTGRGRPEKVARMTGGEPNLTDRFSKMFAPPELYDPKKRENWGLVSAKDGRGPYVIELNLQHMAGLEGASAALLALHKEVLPETEPVSLAKTYFTWRLSVAEWRRLLVEDDRRSRDQAA